MRLSTYGRQTTAHAQHPCAVIRMGLPRNMPSDARIVAACTTCPLSRCWEDMTEAEQVRQRLNTVYADAVVLAAQVGVPQASVALGVPRRTIYRAIDRAGTKEGK